MFHQKRPPTSRSSHWAIGGLALLSLTALVVTAGILADFSRELEIVRQFTHHLPASDLPEAHELAGGLRLQWQLSVLLILNIVASGVAVTLLVRAYLSSERSLRDVRVLAADILDSIDEGIITTDRDGVILSINPCARRLLNRGDDGTGLALKSLPSEHRTLDEIRRRAVEARANIRDQDYTVVDNGKDRYLRSGCSLLRNHNQNEGGAVIHVRDVTDKTLIEQRLLRMERYMGLGSLAAGLHHEIKNPLAALSLHVQLLEEKIEEGDPSDDVRQMLGVIRSEVTRVGEVLENFRDFASLGSLNLSSVNLRELLRRQLDLIAPQAAEQSVTLRLQIADDVPEIVSADWVRLEQVLLNLLINALDVMPTGGTVTVSAFAGSDMVTIEVSDTGSGVPSDMRDRIFDPYFTTKGDGTGLGLALCDKILRQHNGGLDFRSSPHGTTFQVTLPKDTTAQAPSPE